MEELIFIAILIVFSILESISKSKKKRGKVGTDGLPVPEAWQGEEWEEEPDWENEIATYDQEPSYDDHGYDDLTRTLPEPEPPPPTRTADVILPDQLWEEIAALARGVPRPTPPAPKPEPPPPPVVPEREPHHVHLAHAEYGTDPSERSPSEQDGLDPLLERLGADASAARSQLIGHDRHSLRQAIILQQILGPPAALRDEPQ